MGCKVWTSMRIIIGCRHALLREGLRELLHLWSGLEVVGTAPSAAEAARLASQKDPDMLLLVRGEAARDDSQAIETARRGTRHCRVVLIDPVVRRGAQAALGADARISRGVGGAGLVKILWELHTDSLHASRRSTPPDDEPPQQILTDREWEVARAVCEGLPNKAIARQLRISEKTVKNHLSSIYRRAGVSGRTQLAIWAMRRGVASLPPEDGSA